MAPTARGAGAVLAGAALIGTGFTYGYPELVVVGATAVLAALCAVAYAAWRPSLAVSRSADPDRVTRGEPCTQTLTVHNSSRLRSATLVAQDTCGPVTVPVPLLRLRPGRDTSVRYPVPTARRGIVTLGPLRVSRRDPLGLVNVARTHGGTGQVWVHPRTYPLVAVPVGVARSLDGRVDRVPHGTITFDTLREYVIGDELRKVHWRTSARVGQLMVREDLDTSLPRIVVLIDDRRAAYRDIDDDGSENFESVCEAAASVLVAAVNADLAVELVLASSGTGVGSGERHPSDPAQVLAHDERRLSEPTQALVHGGHGAARGDPRPMLDRLAEASPTAEPGALDTATKRLRQHRIGDTLIYLAGSGRPDDLAPVGALAPGYPTIVAGVFGDPDGVPVTVAGMQVLAVADAEEFAAGWDGLGRW
jgi:uncharacterized protein (DUF58 family)